MVTGEQQVDFANSQPSTPMDRREFIKGAVAAAAIGGWPRSIRSQSKSPAVRLSVCIDMILTEIPFLDRMVHVKKLGYPAFEFWDWRSKDLEAIQKKKDELGLEIATMMGSGWKQLFTEEARRGFVEEISASVATAKRLGVKTLIVTTGSEDRNRPRADQHAAYVAALKAAAPVAEQGGVVLALEPLNTKVDHPGYFLHSAKEGFEILDQVGSPAVKMLFDIYHHQIMEGNIIPDITTNISKIAHFHVADVPGRHEPGTGEINYANVFKAIAKTGYNGFVGLEFKPSRNADDVLREVSKLA
jgi:hydroxypyruvate isomerase